MNFEQENNNKTKDKRKPLPPAYYGLGKLQPQAIDLEESILGVLMSVPVDEIIWSLITPEYFYKYNHQKIMQAILILNSLNEPIDILTVRTQLRKQGELEMIGGAYYLTQLTDGVTGSQNLEHNLRVVHQKFIQREVIRIATDSTQKAYEDTTDSLQLLDELKDNINSIQKGFQISNEKNAKELVIELREALEKEFIEGLLGPGTGLISIDKHYKGDVAGDVRIIAGSTGSGKTAFACSEILNCCFDKDKNLLKEQTPVVIYNLEMKSVKLSTRLLSNLSSIPKDVISLNKFDQYEKIRYKEYLEEFEKSKIFIEDRNDLTINQLETSLPSLVKKHGIKKAYVDYVQLMKPDPTKKYQTREQEIADIGRRIKALARKLNITIVILAQLNDEVLKVRNCMPNKSHIRECKSLGHDADNIMLLWRPEYYESVIENLKEIYCPIYNVTITDFTNVAFIIFDKCREGITGKIPIVFKGGIMRMYDHPIVIDSLNGNLFTIPNIMDIEKDPPF